MGSEVLIPWLRVECRDNTSPASTSHVCGSAVRDRCDYKILSLAGVGWEAEIKWSFFFQMKEGSDKFWVKFCPGHTLLVCQLISWLDSGIPSPLRQCFLLPQNYCHTGLTFGAAPEAAGGIQFCLCNKIITLETTE